MPVLNRDTEAGSASVLAYADVQTATGTAVTLVPKLLLAGEQNSERGVSACSAVPGDGKVFSTPRLLVGGDGCTAGAAAGVTALGMAVASSVRARAAAAGSRVNTGDAAGVLIAVEEATTALSCGAADMDGIAVAAGALPGIADVSATAAAVSADVVESAAAGNERAVSRQRVERGRPNRRGAAEDATGEATAGEAAAAATDAGVVATEEVFFCLFKTEARPMSNLRMLCCFCCVRSPGRCLLQKPSCCSSC